MKKLSFARQAQRPGRALKSLEASLLWLTAGHSPRAAIALVAVRETIEPAKHDLSMTKSAGKRTVTALSAKMYRGVRLQKTSGQGRFSLTKIREAVEAAVAKNADALASGQ